MIKALSPRTIALLPEIAAVLLAIVIGATVWLGFAYRQETAAVQHTLEVEKELARVLAVIQDAESSNRGFLLTGNEIYLQAYNMAAGNIAGEIDNLKALVANNSEQQRSLAGLRPIIQSRFERLQEGIELRRTQGLAAAVQHIQSNKGYELMLLVRSGIAQLQRVEDQLLRQRSDKAQQLIRAASAAAFIGIVLVVLAVTGWIWNQRLDALRLAAETAERQQAEAQLRQMQKIEAVGQLTGGIAHDFNNLLTIVISGLSLLKRRLASGNTNVLDVADVAIDGARRAAALTSRLMAFARRQPLEPRSLNANHLVGGMIDMINTIIGKTIAFDSVLAAGVWPAHVDPPQLENAILNLCVNARDAMPAGGRLTIETANIDLDAHAARRRALPPGQYVLIAVSDTGTGMTPEVLTRAFDPFFTTKEEGKGTGLGLSQVHGFVKQSGGHIQIYSEPGHGTSIKVYLPRHIETAPGRLHTHAAEAKSPVTDSQGKQLILVVEDDPRVRELTTSMLVELGFTVIAADGAANALKHLAAHPEIALLFTDIVMPETDGRQLANLAISQRPDLKVLFTTGFSHDAILPGGVLDAGVNFLAKPFTLDQLAAKIRSVLTDRPHGSAMEQTPTSAR